MLTIKNGVIPYSPEVSLWIQCSQIYSCLHLWLQGQSYNQGNLLCSAWQCSIEYPFQLSQDDIEECMQICNHRLQYFRINRAQHQSQHLQNCLAMARNANDHSCLKQIKEIIACKQQRSQFARLHGATGGPQGRIISSVQLNHGGIPIEVSTESKVTAAIISEVHNKRYTLASDTPICQVTLSQDFGLMSLSLAAEEVLTGSYHQPDMDQATTDIFSTVTCIQAQITGPAISTTILPLDWKEYWKHTKEETSLSESGLHFGHYKASTHSHYLNYFHVAKASIALTVGALFTHWQRGVTVIVEKELGVNLV